MIINKNVVLHINKIMKKYLIIPIMFLISYGAMAQGMYNNGARIVVGSNTCLYITGNYRNETNATDGSIDLSGTLKVGGNYTNNVAGSDILSTIASGSEVVFNGTSEQTIGGSTSALFTFPKLTINKASNIVALGKNIFINDSLKFINGLIKIENKNLTFGFSAGVAGIPSASSMIVATGSGIVKKMFSSLGNFTFPVGDDNSTHEYSPVALSFSSGTFDPDAFVGVNLVNAKYNDPAITGSYLNRYWNISQSGITSFSCNAVLKYLPADVTGTESNIMSLRVDPVPFEAYDPANTGLHQLTASGLTSFGTFTGGLSLALAKTLSLKLYLEGYYLGGGLMRQAQGSSGNQFPGTTVDQLTVELHDAVAYNTLVYSVPNIDINTGGDASVTIPGTYSGSYFVTVKHRNSIATVTSSPLSFSTPAVSYDFSTNSAQAYGSNMKNMGSGVYAFYGGDENGDGAVDGLDLIDLENAANAFSTGYVLTDINGDGVVDGFDLILGENNALNFVTWRHP
jgi:hypothetical protein